MIGRPRARASRRPGSPGRRSRVPRATRRRTCAPTQRASRSGRATRWSSCRWGSRTPRSRRQRATSSSTRRPSRRCSSSSRRAPGAPEYWTRRAFIGQIGKWGRCKFLFFGGGKRDRTADLLHVMQRLTPVETISYGDSAKNWRHLHPLYIQRLARFTVVDFWQLLTGRNISNRSTCLARARKRLILIHSKCSCRSNRSATHCHHQHETLSDRGTSAAAA